MVSQILVTIYIAEILAFCFGVKTVLSLSPAVCLFYSLHFVLHFVYSLNFPRHLCILYYAPYVMVAH